MAEKEVRLIDANAFYEKYKHYGLQNGTTVGRHSGMVEYLLDELMKAPTIDAYTEQDVRVAYNDGYSTGMEQGREKAEVLGRWKQNSRGNTYCSECFGETGTQYKYDYCPSCGAKMDKEE